jgi:hypothetical protein
MATLNALNEFVAGNAAVAEEVNENFDALAEFVTTDVVHRDGSQQMTGQLLLENASPTQNNHATRKKYVDDQIAAAVTAAVNANTHGSYVFARVDDNAYGGDTAWNQVVSANVWTTIKFEDLVQNVGNDYDHASGVFTAPKAGLYQVSFTIGAAESSTTLFRTRILMGASTIFNGPRIVPNDIAGQAEAGQYAFITCSHTVYVPADGMTIKPQFNVDPGGTYRPGKTLTIAFLRTNNA